MEIFVTRLRSLIRALGLSDAEAARRAGLSERRFHNYLAGRREPDLTTFARICRSLGTTPNAVLGFDEATVDQNPASASAVGIATALRSAPPEVAALAADIVGVLLRHQSQARSGS